MPYFNQSRNDEPKTMCSGSEDLIITNAFVSNRNRVLLSRIIHSSSSYVMEGANIDIVNVWVLCITYPLRHLLFTLKKWFRWLTLLSVFFDRWHEGENSYWNQPNTLQGANRRFAINYVWHTMTNKDTARNASFI